MALDPYQPCPCGSGQKVKFCCCKDIIGDLERAIRTLESDQRAAALDQIDRLLARHGQRDALLALKAEAQIGVDDWDGAEQTVAAFSAAAPQSTVALAQVSLTAAHRGDSDLAVRSLQRAIERLDASVHYVVYEALTAVSRVLLEQGEVPAARKHLMLEASIADNEEEQQEAVSIWMQVNASPNVMLLLKEDFELVPRPDEAPWGGEFDEALALAGRAAWLAACERLEPLAEREPREPSILKNLAILREWLGHSRAAAVAWRRYAATPNVPVDGAVEAEARAQLLHPQTDGEKLDTLAITHPIADVEKLMERLLSDSRASRLTADPSHWTEQGEPPPKAAFLLLDRPLPKTGAELTLAETPLVIGHLYVFGKQTDRGARAEFSTVRNSDFSSKCDTLADLAGGLLGPAEKEEVIGETLASRTALSWTWRLPDDTPRDRYETLLAEQQRLVMLDVWPKLPLGVLDGRCPRDIAGDPDYRIRLLAAILLFELAAEQQRWRIDFDELRGQLGLPVSQPVNLAESPLSQLPLVRLSRLPASELSDEDLKSSYRRAALAAAAKAIRVLALEAVKRRDLGEPLSKSAAYRVLAALACNSSEALAFNDQARQAAVAEGRSPAQYLIEELGIRLGRRETDACRQLVQRIQTDHGTEPGVSRALYELLVSTGAISPDGGGGARQPGQAAEISSQPAAEPPTSRLWTPDSETPAASSGGKPVIWTPDQG